MSGLANKDTTLTQNNNIKDHSYAVLNGGEIRITISPRKNSISIFRFTGLGISSSVSGSITLIVTHSSTSLNTMFRC